MSRQGKDGDYHGGGSGWRFSWRPDRMQRLHELGRAFELTEDAQPLQPLKQESDTDQSPNNASDEPR